MPTVREDTCAIGIAEEGTWLANKIVSLPEPSEWKITRFDTTPPVSLFLIRCPVHSEIHVVMLTTDVYIHRRICEWPLRVPRELLQEPTERKNPASPLVW